MPLNDLSLDELKEMAVTAATLCRVGSDLENSGLTPIFDLSPGRAVIIRLDAVMPEAPGQATKEDVARVEAKVDQRLSGVAELVRQVMTDSQSATYAAAVPPRNWATNDENLVAAIYARSHLENPAIDPSYEAAKATNRAQAEVDAYFSAHLWSLCDSLIRSTKHRLHVLANSTPSTEAAPSEPALVPVDLPPAVEGPVGGDPQSSAAPSSAVDVASPPPEATGDLLPQPEAAAVGVAEDSGGGQQLAAAPSPAAPLTDRLPSLGAGVTSPSISHERTFSGTAVWTEKEDARLVDMVADGIVRLGLSKSAAMRAAAAELARPEQGTAFRCQHKLKARIDAAIAQGNANLKQGEADQLPGQGEAERTVRAAASIEGQLADAKAAVPEKARHKPEHIADPVTAHLMALTDKGGWTLDRDLELMELSIAGWGPNEIALQLTMQAGAIKPRFDALTGLYTDANDKKQRRFSREAVFEALTKLAGKVA